MALSPKVTRTAAIAAGIDWLLLVLVAILRMPKGASRFEMGAALLGWPVLFGVTLGWIWICDHVLTAEPATWFMWPSQKMETIFNKVRPSLTLFLNLMLLVAPIFLGIALILLLFGVAP